MTSALVVGAGIGGLTAAWELARAGCSVTVIEAAERPGGLVSAAVLEGVPVDVGAEGYSVRGGVVADLLTELGAGDLIEHPNPAGAWLQTPTGAFPIPRRLVFGMPADVDADDVRAVVGDIPAAREAGGSLAEVVAAAYGARVLADLVAPLVGGVYSTRPEDVTLGEVSPKLAGLTGAALRVAVREAAAHAPAAGAVHGVRGGMHRLIDLLIAATGQSGAFDLRRGEAVQSVEVTDGGCTVTTTRGRLRADLAVLAVGVDVAARLLAAPAVPRPTSIEVVAMAIPAEVLAGEAPRGTGVLVAPGAGVHAKALTHSTAKWQWLRDAAPGIDLLRLSYGQRGQRLATAGLDSDAMVRLVRSDASALLGRELPAPQAVHRQQWSILVPGTPSLAVAREWLTGRRRANLALVGAGFAGTGLANVVPHTRAEMRRLMRSDDE